jgi:branched-chain amino acid transport system permease protein
MWMGLFIVALIIFAPKGILGLVNRFIGDKSSAGNAAAGKGAGHD